MSSRSVLHDKDRYPDPHTFNPSRFLTADGQLDLNAPDPAEASFGFGRRICPGRHFAMESIWITMVYMLATVKIEKAVDNAGNVIIPNDTYTSGTIRSVDCPLYLSRVLTGRIAILLLSRHRSSHALRRHTT